MEADIPAFFDVDRQLNVSSHSFLEHGAVCIVVAFSVHRQLVLISTDRHLATAYHTRHRDTA